MGFHFTITVAWEKKISRIFKNVSELPKDLRPAFESIDEILREEWSDNFTSKSGNGGAWAEWSPATAADPRARELGIRPGEMGAAVGGGRGAVKKIKRQSAELGAGGVKLVVFHKGKYNQPARPIITMNDNSKHKIINVFRSLIRRAVKK